jgi:hypothetical protein
MAIVVEQIDHNNYTLILNFTVSQLDEFGGIWDFRSSFRS